MLTREKQLLMRAILCTTLGVAIAIAAGLWFCSAPLRVKVFDPEFHEATHSTHATDSMSCARDLTIDGRSRCEEIEDHQSSPMSVLSVVSVRQCGFWNTHSRLADRELLSETPYRVYTGSTVDGL